MSAEEQQKPQEGVRPTATEDIWVDQLWDINRELGKATDAGDSSAIAALVQSAEVVAAGVLTGSSDIHKDVIMQAQMTFGYASRNRIDAPELAKLARGIAI